MEALPARNPVVLLMLTGSPLLPSATNVAGLAFLRANMGRSDVVTRASGLQYKVLRAGRGHEYPTLDSETVIHYEGRTVANYPSGPKFVSTFDRCSRCTVMVDQNHVIAGWREAMMLMVEGAKWEIYMPSELATYGQRERPPGVATDEALIFTIELIKIHGPRVPVAATAASATMPDSHPPTVPFARCVDPFHAAEFNCSEMKYSDEVRETLCPRIAAIQRASCSQLSNLASLTKLIDSPSMTVLWATGNVSHRESPSDARFTGPYKPGLVHSPRDIATLLIHLASDARFDRLQTNQLASDARDRKRPSYEPLRFVSTDSNNGWVTLLAAAFLERTHRTALHGLAVSAFRVSCAWLMPMPIFMPTQ
uniref:peptidylprolyl isomerase n=1 Tax=Haptolina brevifila TaxID=156173 RepID=A0A7S2H671_9EUKA